MTRNEEILKAARDYISGVSLSSPSNFIHFAAGARWADERPNLEKLWHDASEEPRCDELLLGEDTYGFSIYRWCGQEDDWEAFVNETGLRRWAYITDLLPKQFGNSEQLKGGEL